MIDIYVMGAGAALIAFWCFFILIADKHVDIVFAIASFVVAAMIYANEFCQSLVFSVTTSGTLCAIISIYYMIYCALSFMQHRKFLMWQQGGEPKKKEG